MLGALSDRFSGLATWQRPDGGFFVGVNLQKQLQADELLQRALAAGVVLTDGRGFFADGRGDQFLRLPFCALTIDEIRLGIARLADIVSGIT